MTKQTGVPSGSAIALLALAALATGFARAGEGDRFQGTWKAIFGEIGGKEATSAQLKGFQAIVDGDKFILVEGAGKETVHFTLNPDAKPRAVDFYKGSGKKDKLWHGIYEFNGKDLKQCWGPAGGDRPKDFNSKASNQHRYFIFHKQ
jgi:uncharacterized protein (TIGR03067 family)